MKRSAFLITLLVSLILIILSYNIIHSIILGKESQNCIERCLEKKVANSFIWLKQFSNIIDQIDIDSIDCNYICSNLNTLGKECKKITNYAARSGCYSTIESLAKNLDEPLLCDNIEEFEEDRDMCYYYFAMNLSDISFCENINDPTVKKMCKEWIDCQRLLNSEVVVEGTLTEEYTCSGGGNFKTDIVFYGLEYQDCTIFIKVSQSTYHPLYGTNTTSYFYLNLKDTVRITGEVEEFSCYYDVENYPKILYIKKPGVDII